MSFEDRLTRVEIAVHTREDELDRLGNRLENFIGEARFRFDRLDTGLAAARKEIRDMHSKLDVIVTKFGERGS